MYYTRQHAPMQQKLGGAGERESRNEENPPHKSLVAQFGHDLSRII